MCTKNTCYTYFKIVGSFKTDEISKMLELFSDKKSNSGVFLSEIDIDMYLINSDKRV